MSAGAPLRLLCADARGTLYAHPHLRAAGMEAGGPVPLRSSVLLPYGSRLMALPGWEPVGYDPATGSYEILKEILVGRRWVRVCAVAAVPPPGFLRLLNPAAVRTGRGWVPGPKRPSSLFPPEQHQRPRPSP